MTIGREDGMLILDEAKEVVSGQRAWDYGTPADNHRRTAAYWQEYLEGRYGVEIPVDAADVCFLNILQKISRAAKRITRDTLVDIAGYAENVELIAMYPRGGYERTDNTPLQRDGEDADRQHGSDD
jgi:hypothetical protein